MHRSSYQKMATFKEKFLRDQLKHPLKILEVGSQDINGSYRPLFSEPHWTYHGADLVAGQNVDIVLRTPYTWSEIKSASYDVIISGQTFEHTEYFWLTMLEIARALKNNGLCCLIAPSTGPEHRYPVDCYRFYVDGMVALARFAGLQLLQAETQWDTSIEDEDSALWCESFLVAQKPLEHGWQRFRRYVQYRALQWSIIQPPQEYYGDDLVHMPPHLYSSHMSGNREYKLNLKEIQAKEEEIQRLAKVCAEREALINQLSAICAEREALINQLSAAWAEREALLQALSAKSGRVEGA